MMHPQVCSSIVRDLTRYIVISCNKQIFPASIAENCPVYGRAFIFFVFPGLCYHLDAFQR